MRSLCAILATLLLCACGVVKEPSIDVILADQPARTLHEYGLFSDPRARVPAPSVLEYDLVNPLFSDHTTKHRFVFLPDGKRARYRADDVLEFPVGTVLVKTFAYEDRNLETRLLIHKHNGWVALPYVWNESQTEAVYSPVGARISIEKGIATEDTSAFVYAVPNKNQCKTCHQTGRSVSPIGPKARNLNHDGPSGRNQIEDMVARGILIEVPSVVPSMAEASDIAAPLGARARAYLDINCAHCHKANGSASNSGLWLEWEQDDPIRMGVGKHPTAAGRGAGDALVVIEPGHPDESIMIFRMATAEAGIAMPELGRALVDAEGLELITAWIAEMDARN